MSKKVLVALPESLLDKIDFAAEAECRTRSDLVREALRRYIDNFNRQRLMLVTPANISVLEDAYAKTPSDGVNVMHPD